MIGDVTFSWKPNDIFIAPSWNRHQADGDAMLFSFSDRVVQENLVWRGHQNTSWSLRLARFSPLSRLALGKSARATMNN